MALKRKPSKSPAQNGTKSDQAVEKASSPSPSISFDEAERYRTIIQTANEGIWLIDLEGRTLFANDRLAKLLGYRAEEMVGRTVLEFTFPEDVPSAQARIGSNLQGHFEHFDFRFRRRDGSELPVLASTSPVRDASGQITGALGMFTDLTERKRLERELAAQAALLEAAFGAMTEGVIIYDRTGKPLRMNAAARHVLEIGVQTDYLDHPLAERTRNVEVRNLDGQVVPFEQWPIFRILRGEAIPSNAAVEVQLQTREGRKAIINYSGGPLRDQAGEIIGAVTMTRDVTEQRNLEQRTQKALEALLQMAHTLTQPALDARQASEEKISALLRQLAELACRVLACERLNLVLLQEETETLEPLVMVGISPEQEQMWRLRMRGLAVSEYLTAESIARLKAGEAVLVGADQRLLPIQTPALEVAHFLVVPLRAGKTLLGGMSLDYGSRGRAYTSDELVLAQALGNLVALMLEREQLVLASRQARAQVETLEQEKNERETFISLVVHELRTPLTVISAQAQLLARNASMHEAKRDEALRRMLEQTRRLRRLIDDLQDVSRIAAGTFELSPELTDLSALARNVVEEQQATTQRHALRLDMPAAPIVGMWDRERLSQVLSNLLSNAIKYAEGGEVRVTLNRSETGVQVAVQDQGAGMTAEEIGRLFQLYSRLARTRHIAGNGLGLYLTRGILAAHGGRIWASSPGPGQGSTFTFTLPLSVTP